LLAKNVSLCDLTAAYGRITCKTLWLPPFSTGTRDTVSVGSGLHIDQGIAVTSHASQAKTVNQVIVSVPVRAFSQANEAQFYVSMSRGRSAMHLFTDSKVALREAVTRPSKRLSSWELVEGAEKDRALKAELDRQRAKAKEELQERTYER
jgi:hypothetical protein